MNSPFDDPFDAPTVIRPRPGGRPISAPPWAAADTDSQPSAGADAEHGLSPLLAAANPVLMLVPHLRQTAHVPDVAALRDKLVRQLAAFNARARALAVPPDQLRMTHYVLCTALDEAASATPWGGLGVWSRHSLLVQFHGEAVGGDRIFEMLRQLKADPARHLAMLELFYAALSLGLAGRFHLEERGQAMLAQVRTQLANLITSQRGHCPDTLSPNWKADDAPARPVWSWLALVTTAALTALLLGLVYAGLAQSLSVRTTPVYEQIQALRLAPPVPVQAREAAVPRLAVLLAPDIQAGLISVRDELDRGTVTLHSDKLFAKASAALDPGLDGLVQRIGTALASVGGEVRVTGHTDSSPIRTLEFPSNWHLSERRALAVRQLLIAAGVPAARVRAEGRAAGEPVASNAEPMGQARNRRVEIALLVPAALPNRPTGR